MKYLICCSQRSDIFVFYRDINNGNLVINVEPEFEEDYAESKTLDGKLVIVPKIERV